MVGRDDGAGVISTFFGAVVFLFFLLFAAHLLLGLYAESVVGAVAYDTAKTAAGSDALSAGTRALEAGARSQLGRLGAEAVFVWAVDDDAVRLTVRVPRQGVLAGLPGLPGRGPIERTVRVRAERVR